VVSAIGHEQDSPLLDHVADVRASTPTDAAKLLVPDLAEQLVLVDALWARAGRAVAARLDREQRWLIALLARPALADPAHGLAARGEAVQSLQARALRCVRHRLDRAGDELIHRREQLRALSPQATLDRGYAIVQRADGSVLRDPAEVVADEELMLRLAGGTLPARARAGDVPRRSTPSSSAR
jgi:exodeoxyribonuclease VII large subunit